MNPHYNQQPYYSYQQHTPGPPQPPWQGAPAQQPQGWHDPRYNNSPQQNPQSPASQYNQPFPPPPPPPPPSGQPSNFQSHSGYGRPQDAYNRPETPQYNTSNWGVRYNQTQQNQQQQQQHPQATLQQEQRPALPPRPNSTQNQAGQQYSTANNNRQSYDAAQYRRQSSWGNPNVQAQEPKPPNPPPRPAAYALQNQYLQQGYPQEQYSHHPSTHHYDPQAPSQPDWHQPQHQPQQQPQQQPQSQSVPIQQTPSPLPSRPVWGSSQQTADQPVSPIEDDRHRFSIAGQPTSGSTDSRPYEHRQQAQPSRASVAVSPEVHTSATVFGGNAPQSLDWQHFHPSDLERPVSSGSKPASYGGAEGAQSSLMTASPAPADLSVAAHHMQSPVQIPPATLQQQRNESYDQQHGKANAVEHPARQPSQESAVSSLGGITRNDTIDNVIQAWYAPLTTDTSVQTSLPPSRTPSRGPLLPHVPIMDDKFVQTDFTNEPVLQSEPQVVTKEVEVDPYADIQNEYKATLKRFAGMLRQEAAAKDDEEKFKIFQGFVIRELRLRSVLYGIEAIPHEQLPKQVQDKVAKESIEPQDSSASADTRSVADNVDQKADAKMSGKPQQPPNLPALDVGGKRDPKPDEGANFSGSPEDVYYSPGGRPMMMSNTSKTQSSRSMKDTSSSERTVMPIQTKGMSGDTSPSANAPMTLEDYAMPEPERPSPSTNAPMVVGADELGPVTSRHVDEVVPPALSGPLNFQPARPVYQPFRYEGSEGPTPLIQVHGPPAESFASLRQTQAVESGRTLLPDGLPSDVDLTPNRDHAKTPSGGRREHEEAFIGLIRAKSRAIRKSQMPAQIGRPDSPAILRAGTPIPKTSPTPPPLSPFVKSLQTLRSTVPKDLPPIPNPKSAPPAKLEPISSSLQKLPDDFSFIHARVLSWDRSNRQLRAKQDSERQTRQSNNEEHIDQLFNENEIGYADIAGLEKDFQLEEATRKYKEDQEELESFSTGVYQYVVERLEDEITELTRLQTNAIDMLDLESASAAKQLQAQQPQSSNVMNNLSMVPTSAVMQRILDIHQKLELRHLKVAEANFERERRRKRLETSVLFVNSDKAGVKKLEAEYVKAEKLHVLEENRKKAERANRLLDSFDRAVVRGLAENQGLVDEILNKSQLFRDVLFGSNDNQDLQGAAGSRDDLLYGPDGVQNLMSQTSSAVNFILTDSRSLVELLNRADNLSNDADFALYISEAKLADASPDKFKKLEQEKKAEDRNVGEELASRISGITRAPEEINGLVREVKDRIGEGPGHDERIKNALEAAKMRNKSPDPTPEHYR